MTLTVGSLCSGIGGIDLAFSLAGFDIRWQVEIDPFCQKILKKHAPVYWPNAKVFDDVRECGRHNLDPVRILVAGIPCQPASHAGRRKGKEDNRWLWPEALRIVREIQPQVCLFENVSGLRTLDGGDTFREIVGELAKGGFDLTWRHFRASDVGAPHRRERIFIVAYARHWRRDEGMESEIGIIPIENALYNGPVVNDQSSSQLAQRPGREPIRSNGKIREGTVSIAGSSSELAHATPSSDTYQPTGVDQETLGSPFTGTGGGTNGGHSAEGISVDGRTVTSSDAHVGNASGLGRGQSRIQHHAESELAEGGTGHLAHASDQGLSQPGQPGQPALAAQGTAGLELQPKRRGGELVHTDQKRLSGWQGPANPTRHAELGASDRRRSIVSVLDRAAYGISRQLDGNRRIYQLYGIEAWPARWGQAQFSWEAPRTVRKLPGRAARLKALGNAVVIQIAFPIAQAIYTFLEEEDC